MSDWLESEGQKIENERPCDLCPGAELVLNRWCQKRPQTSKCNCEKKDVDCSDIKLTLGTEGYKNLYTNIVWSYSQFLNKPKGFRLLPITLRAARQVGLILKYLEDADTSKLSQSYRFYM